MACFQRNLTFRTSEHNEVIDITEEVRRVVAEARIEEGQCAIYTPHATAAIAINENDDPNIGVDFLAALRKIVIEHDGWLHDRIDNNAAAHIKSAIVGPSETIPKTRTASSLPVTGVTRSALPSANCRPCRANS